MYRKMNFHMKCVEEKLFSIHENVFVIHTENVTVGIDGIVYQWMMIEIT